MGKLSLSLLLLWMLCLPITAAAQAPQREPAFVYATNSYSPSGYVPAMYPTHLDTIYFMADQANALAPRNTLIYWWPASNEYRADWTARNELLEGVLEVVGSGGQIVKSATLTDYIVQFDARHPQETLALISGPNAKTKYDEFVNARTAYWESVREYQKKNLEYSAQIDEVVQKSEGGTKPQVVPPKPTPPPDFTMQSSVPVQAFVITLPAGEYRVRLKRPDGTYPFIAEKKLIAFKPRRQAISYTIIPQSKWTIPETSADPAEVVYVQGRTTLYLQPFLGAEFNQLYYQRLQNPQSVEGRVDQWQWVSLAELDAKTLRVTPESGASQSVSNKPYRVSQLPGTELGYEVLDYDPKTMRGAPSFEGFKIEVDDQRPAWSVALLDNAGTVVPGSVREIRMLQTPSPLLYYTLPFAALIVGGAMLWWRRRQLAKLPKDAAG